jgi:UDP-glucose 4-epimerase
MRLFVTGASGFIGRRLLDVLGQHEVVCLSRQGSSLVAQTSKPNANVKIIRGDLGQPEIWLTQVAQFSPHCCIHLAWEGLPDYSRALCQRNLDIGIGLFDGLARAHVRTIVVAGSCWEYGAATGPVAESHRVSDRGLFAASKDALRIALDDMASKTGMGYRWARIFFAYGPGQRASSLIPQCRAAFSTDNTIDIRQPRVAQDFIHVDDVVRGLLAMAECDMGSGTYNLGTGVPTAVGEVANHVANHFGVTPPYAHPGFDSGFWADTKKMAAATGWRAQIQLADGIARTLEVVEPA